MIGTAFIKRVLRVFHFVGIIIMTGTIMIDYFTFKTFWVLAYQDYAKSFGLLPLMAQYGFLVRTGAIMIILTGVSLRFLQEEHIWWKQFWFKVKMGLVFLLILNGLLIGSRQADKLRETVAANADNYLPSTIAVRKTLGRFYAVQLTLFFLIISVSTIKLKK